MRRPVPSSLADYVDALAARGRYLLRTDEARTWLHASEFATRAALRRLADRGRIASPTRGFHVIVPPEYRRLGCLPPEQFVPELMSALGIPYYVALLSAAQVHGGAHHRPQEFQVAVAKNRDPIECGSVRVAFVARKRVAEVPTITVNTPRGVMRVSTVEATALDLVGYPGRAGGLDNIATVLAELVEKIDAKRLASAAASAPVSWAQRLGYLLDRAGGSSRTGALAEAVRNAGADAVLLAPSVSARRARRDTRWKVDVNVKLGPEA